MRDAKRIGVNIKNLRKQQKLSQEMVCDTEEELTVRQLRRIEKGEAFPTSKTLEFISERLKIPIERFFATHVELFPEVPKDYLELKDKLFLLALSDHPEANKTYRKVFNLIEEKFENILPSEEQLVLDFHRQKLDKEDTSELVTRRHGTILKEIRNRHTNEWDLKHLGYVVVTAHALGMRDSRQLLSTCDFLLKNADAFTSFESALVLDILILSMQLFFEEKNFHVMIEGIEISSKLAQKFELDHKLALIKVMEGKFYMYGCHDEPMAKRSYEHALLLMGNASVDIKELINDECRYDVIEFGA